ncbi:MAG: biotin--[acetyl-CoA-carboxylase] ligase [Eubacterium sp.]|nr:biotin--[acetyl-CoA-carboxylase] ligase [Eubacterium sp.]
MDLTLLKSLYNIEAVKLIHEFKTTDSTNQRAKEDIRDHMEDEDWLLYSLPALYVADIQTAGRGRLGRTWSSDSESGIWMSYLFAPKLSPEKIPSITLLASLAVADAITEYAERHKYAIGKVQIKWPNDIVINKKKVCGILTELVAPNYVITGIGVNANTKEFDAELIDKATSLFIESGYEWSRETLVYLIIRKFTDLVEEYEKSKSLDFIVDRYNEMLVSMNEEVVIVNSVSSGTSEPAKTFTCKGINNTGALLIEDNSGNISTVSSGEVSVRGIYGYV